MRGGLILAASTVLSIHSTIDPFVGILAHAGVLPGLRGIHTWSRSPRIAQTERKFFE